MGVYDVGNDQCEYLKESTVGNSGEGRTCWCESRLGEMPSAQSTTLASTKPASTTPASITPASMKLVSATPASGL